MKLMAGGRGREMRQESTRANKIGSTAKLRKGNGIRKFDSIAERSEGIGRSSSHCRACRIKAKKTTAIAKPVICTGP